MVPAIEGLGVAREEGAHAARERPAPRPDQVVRVVREKGLGLDGEGAGLGERDQARDEVRAVGVIPEEGTPLEPPQKHVVEGVRGIQAGLAGHWVFELR